MKRSKEEKRKRIHYRIRKKVSGTADAPRLTVFKSNTSIYCQLIDDTIGHTVVAASSKEANSGKVTKTDQAKAVGMLIAEKAKSANIQKVTFDRSGYLYHGRVKALADGAREGGLQF
ncbi:MAG: 50S ribosomal protein L18 [Saprospiraceae bacterium]|jgi:large subunit ribosomal protein L18|nr:50S ribosomal protein L18 [Saprospiraceae bacterium]